MIKKIWRYRAFIVGSVNREYQVKYKNSLLGLAWTVINPLAMILVYTVIFSQVMKTKLPNVENIYGYSVYICAGLITWGFFSEILNRGCNLFIDNSNLLKKINFPRITLPIIAILSAGINFIIIFSLFLVYLLMTNQWPGYVAIGVIAVLMIQLLFSIGLSIVLGVLNVFYRDVGPFLAISLQFWFWLTPIIYPISILPERIASMMELNPMFPIIVAYQAIFVYQTAPNWNTLIYPLLMSIFLCALAAYVYRNSVHAILDEI